MGYYKEITQSTFISSKKNEDLRFAPHTPSYGEISQLDDFPIPPQQLWANYGKNAEEYVESGRIHLEQFIHFLGDSGINPKSVNRVLDFGCAAGRMTRWALRLLPQASIWGCDVNADQVHWASRNLVKNASFFVNTNIPHLPFVDGYFDFIYCGSVFTHIDDLSDTWLLELRRVLSKKGALLITIHDENTLSLLQKGKTNKLFEGLMAPYLEVLEIAKDNYFSIAIDRINNSNIFFNSKYYLEHLSKFFKVTSYRQELHGYQSGILLQNQE